MLPEISTALREKRHELHLDGSKLGQFLGDDGSVPPELFKLSLLNFLEISSTKLLDVPADLGKLAALTNLALFGNAIERVDDSIGSLSKLKFLDLSRNKISKLPDTLSNLTQLQTLNVRQNELTELPDLSGSYLVHLECSHNAFESIPDWLANEKLEHLTDIDFSHNQVCLIPEGLSVLPQLKLLNLEENLITVVPGELGDAPKLKDFLLKGNKLKDNRLRKLVDGKPKSVMEYVRKSCPRSGGTGAASKKKGKKTTSVSEDGDGSEAGAPVEKNIMLVRPPTTEISITVTDALNKIRPHIVCCILKNVDLSEDNMKKFIALQVSGEGVCLRSLTIIRELQHSSCIDLG